MSVPKSHPFDFDPTYGMQREQLLAITPPEAPPGFDDFWKSAIAAHSPQILDRYCARAGSATPAGMSSI